MKSEIFVLFIHFIWQIEDCIRSGGNRKSQSKMMKQNATGANDDLNQLRGFLIKESSKLADSNYRQNIKNRSTNRLIHLIHSLISFYYLRHWFHTPWQRLCIIQFGKRYHLTVELSFFLVLIINMCVENNQSNYQVSERRKKEQFFHSKSRNCNRLSQSVVVYLGQTQF